MSDGAGTLSARVMIILFASAIVAIAGHQISRQYAPKKIAKSPASKEALLDEFRGDIDVAKASVSPQYVEKYSRKQNENEKEADSSSKPAGSTLDTAGLKNLLNKLAP